MEQNTRLIFALAGGATLPEYVEGLRASRTSVVPGSDRTYWVTSGKYVRRWPPFHVGTPSQFEIDLALRSTGGLIATYLTEPNDQFGSNAWLYLCSDQEYSWRSLPSAMHRNLRRGMRELTIASLSGTELLAHGGPAFCDTRRRNGLNDGTPIHFRRYFEHRIGRPGVAYLGAWKNGQLAAFLAIIHVDDWVEILGCFSQDSTLAYRPNDVLMYAVLSHYLSERRCRVVSYGVSSIQASSHAAGLHRFKEKVGFRPILVHRAFTPHPLLRVFTNAFTLAAAHSTVKVALWLRPCDVRLKTMEGMLASMRGLWRLIDTTEGDRNDESLSARSIRRD